MNDNIVSIEQNFKVFQEEIAKFVQKDNSSAGSRARKALLEVNKLSKVLRKQIQERKNSLKVEAA